MRSSPPPFPLPDQPSVAGTRAPVGLHVLTVNAHKGFTFFNRKMILHELRDAIRYAAPDVVFLQEIIGEHQRHASRYQAWPTLTQYEFLADELWPNFAYGRNAVYTDGHHGNAILSKYPIIAYDNHDISVPGHENRGLLHCVLDVEGVPVHAVCVHLGLHETHRRLQLESLCALLRDTLPDGEPVVVAGDFNDWRRRAGQVLAACGATEVYTDSFGAPARTFPARFPLLPLDRIYVRNIRQFKPRPMSARPWRALSDHLPIAAEVEV
ncbi:Endonuclease/Exonuclease/phosphatase family protein [plant metagenome]|uniref:Endonuclease/Exonuclease/phosphatase family protein n=1 Tax=plant metagenome TaxID=1297885 RepID=A0A484SZU1_9ZZZZ